MATDRGGAQIMVADMVAHMTPEGPSSHGSRDFVVDDVVWHYNSGRRPCRLAGPWERFVTSSINRQKLAISFFKDEKEEGMNLGAFNHAPQDLHDDLRAGNDFNPEHYAS